jgi:hypothetical protein
LSNPNVIAKINECKTVILTVCTLVNDLRRAGIKIEFTLGITPQGMQELMQFHAYEELNIQNN